MAIQQTDDRISVPTVLDIFCGAGGMSLGFQNAGCHIIGGIDANPHAVKTHHKNFPECEHKWIAQDIRGITNLSNLGIEPGKVDILIGGPPCQVFSRVGIGYMKKLKWDVKKDHKNFLYKEYTRFLEYYQPHFFVMENVDNLKNKTEVFSKIIAELKNCGYRIHYRVLDSSMFGVPQRRLRVFIVGAHERIDCDIEDAAFGVHVFPTQDKTVSVGEAISDLPELQPIKIPLKSKSTGPRQTDRPVNYRCNPESFYQEKMRKGNGKTVWNHLCRAHNEKDLEIFGMLQQGGKYKDLPEEVMRYRVDIFDDKYRRLKWYAPSWTLTAHMSKDCLAYVHPRQNRSISVREAARIQSFPDDFVFYAPMTKMFELIGNSVPPLLAEAVAKPIVRLVREYDARGSRRAHAKHYQHHRKPGTPRPA